MKRALLICPLLVGLCLAGGCGGSSNDALMKETIDHVNEICAILEKSENAKDAKPNLEGVVAKHQALKKRLSEAKGTKAEGEALQKKYEPEMRKAKDRLEAAGKTFASKDPAGFLELLPVLQKLQ